MARTRALVLVLLMGAACLDKSTPVTSATSTGELATSSGGEGSTGTITGGVEIECGDVTCTKSQVCVIPIPTCVLVDRDTCGSSGGSSAGDTDSSGGSSEQCFIDEPLPLECRAIPSGCADVDNFESCVAEQLCAWHYGQFNEGGRLRCGYVFDHCLEGDPQHDLCPC